MAECRHDKWARCKHGNSDAHGDLEAKCTGPHYPVGFCCACDGVPTRERGIVTYEPHRPEWLRRAAEKELPAQTPGRE